MKISLHSCQGCGEIISEKSDTWRCLDKTYCSEKCIYNIPTSMTSQVQIPSTIPPTTCNYYIIIPIFTCFCAGITLCI